MRRIQKLMQEWTFTGKDGKATVVDLPHTWNAKDGQDGGNDYYRGTCVYDKEFMRPDYDRDKEAVYLQFQGVNSSASVFLNGEEIRKHHGGYSTFRIEITDRLVAHNHLQVRVDNSKNETVYPQMADFTFYGGIYRDVELLIVSKEHFALDYYGGQGLRVTPEVVDNGGKIRVQTYTNVDNAKVFVYIMDREGVVVAEGEGTDVICTIKKAHLWKGKKDPYLYTVQAVLKRGDEVLDEVSCKCGIRSIYFDPHKGFFLNGESYPLRGVARHQDFRGIGNAITMEHAKGDMELIKEVGANTIRLAHYQHDQYFYDLCDEEGMIVWAEIPYISAHMPEAKENTFLQMRELIVQSYNHPSIVTWGISNEITISRKHKRDMLDNHRELQRLCKELDPTRPTTLACYAMCSPFHPVTKITDLVGWNLYLGWYVPGLFLNDWFMKFYHFIYPKRPLCYSEYGAEGMPNLHSEKPKRGDNTEEYQRKYHEYMLECFERHPFLWGTYVWNMFDFAADARNQGGEPGMNHKGLVTFDRQIKKDSFYLYKAWWSEEPFIHLAGKRFKYRTGDKTELTVYTNQREVTLFQNGRNVGTQRGTHVFKFQISLQEKNELEVRSGRLTDQAVIYHTDTPRPEYQVQKSDTRNWM